MATIIDSGGAIAAPVTRPSWLKRWLAVASACDRAWLAIGAILAVLAILAPNQAVISGLFVLKALWSILPFLLLSIAIGAYAKATGADSLIARAFYGRAAIAVVFAALAGALSPFCSCGVIPVIAALLVTGVPLAPVMAFWLASPLMDPSQFFLTAGVLGMPFAVAKTVAAIGVGLLGGFGVLALQGIGMLTGPALRDGAGNGGCAGSKIRNPKDVVWRAWQGLHSARTFVGSNGRPLSASFTTWCTSFAAVTLPSGLQSSHNGRWRRMKRRNSRQRVVP